MEYKILIDRLNHRGLFHIKPGLDRIRTVLGVLGNPQENLRCLHIAGTNGKGSVAACLESVLRNAGYRTGLYSSQHLHDVRERIQINRLPITERHFQTLANQVFEAEAKARVKLTYFEFITAMAFLAFVALRVDVVVLEAGMGGRWDATNIIQQAVLSIITSVGLDHMQWLGGTETAIAQEKAGILKAGTPVVSGVRGRAARIIDQAAHEMKLPLYRLGTEFSAESISVDWNAGLQRLRYSGMRQQARHLQLGLLGSYQVDNAATALAAIELLNQRGFRISASAIDAGLGDTAWAGRFQIFPGHEGPTILLDGAHNPPAMRRLLDALRASPWRKCRKHFIFSAYRDKDYHGMINLLEPQSAQLYVTTMPGARALPAEQLAAALTTRSKKVKVIRAPLQAYRKAVQGAAKDDLVVVTGSLTLVGQLLPAAHAIETPFVGSAPRA